MQVEGWTAVAMLVLACACERDSAQRAASQPESNGEPARSARSAQPQPPRAPAAARPPADAATAQDEPAVTQGTLTPAQIRAVMLAAAEATDGCLGTETAVPTVRARVELDGTVSEVRIENPPDALVRACLEAVVRDLRFPPAERVTHFAFPLEPAR